MSKNKDKKKEETAEPVADAEPKPTEGDQPVVSVPAGAEATPAETTEETPPKPEGTEGEPVDGKEPGGEPTEEQNQEEGKPVDETGEKPVTEGEQPPTEGEQPPAEGEQPPTEGEQPATEPEPLAEEQPTPAEEPQPVEEEPPPEEEKPDTSKPSDRIWDGTIKQEHLDYMILAQEIGYQNSICEELKQLIDERLTRPFSTKCEERELKSLRIEYAEENAKLMGLMREAIGLQFDSSRDDQEKKKDTTVKEDLNAARMLRDLCATCKPGPCDLEKKKPKDEKCKRCGASTGRKAPNTVENLEKVVKRIEKTLNSLKKNLNDLKR